MRVADTLALPGGSKSPQSGTKPVIMTMQHVHSQAACGARWVEPEQLDSQHVPDLSWLDLQGEGLN